MSARPLWMAMGSLAGNSAQRYSTNEAIKNCLKRAVSAGGAHVCVADGAGACRARMQTHLQLRRADGRANRCIGHARMHGTRLAAITTHGYRQ